MPLNINGISYAKKNSLQLLVNIFMHIFIPIANIKKSWIMFCNFKYYRITQGLSIEFLSWKGMRCLITGIAVNFIPIASHRPVRYLRVYARRLSIIPLTNSGLYEYDENTSAFKTVASVNTIKIRVNIGWRRFDWYFLQVHEYKVSNNTHTYWHILLFTSRIIFDILISNR